jgi:uncharacterized protein DUF6916
MLALFSDLAGHFAARMTRTRQQEFANQSTIGRFPSWYGSSIEGDRAFRHIGGIDVQLAQETSRMGVSRRNFLQLGQVFLAAAAFPTKFWGASPARLAKTANLGTLKMASFQPLVNSSFSVGSDSSTTAWFRLLSVEAMNAKAGAAPLAGMRTRSRSAALDTFALHFQATGEDLPQGTYEFEHPSLGSFPLFVVPSGPTTYVAIINHIESLAVPILPPGGPKRPRLTVAAAEVR